MAADDLQPCAVVFGASVPAGIGGATAMRFADAGLPVYLSGLHQDKLEVTARAIEDAGGAATVQVVDATQQTEVHDLFEQIEQDGFAPEFVLHNVGVIEHSPFLDISAEALERVWRIGCLSGFIVGQEAISRMLPQGQGTLLFTGASASLRGGKGFASFAAAKAGLRIYAQAMAREFGPKGIHVAHVIVDGIVHGQRAQRDMADVVGRLGEEGTLDPAAIAEAYWDIHCQHKTAWSHEVDLRPFSESW